MPGPRISRRLLLHQAALAGIASLLGSHLRSGPRLPPLRLGLLLPRSGYLEAAGTACADGARLALALLHELELPGLQLVDGDSGETPESAQAAALQLFARGIDILVGCFDSSQTVEVAALAEQHTMPMIINIGAAPSITAQGYRYVFRNFPDATRIVFDSYSLQKQLFAQTGFTPRKLVVLHINNGRGLELIDSLYPQMRMPYEKVGAVAYDPRAQNLAEPVAAARATGADAVWTVSRLGDAIRIGRELVRQNWTPGVLISSNAGLHDPAYRAALGSAADYAITFAPFYDPRRPLARRLQQLQRVMVPGTPLSTEQVYTFEAVITAADAYRRAASTQPAHLAQALRETSLTKCVTGDSISFDAHGQNTSLGLVAIQNQRGEPRVVLPLRAAEGRPLLPMPAWNHRD